MNSERLSNLLDLLPGPARVIDDSGAVIAQNDRARSSGRSDLEHGAQWANETRHNLGGGWNLHLWSEGASPKDGGAQSPAVPRIAPAPRTAAGTAPSGAQLSGVEIGTLANSMAHSIRNPLSAIVTAASLVQDDAALGEESAMLLGVIRKEALHLNNLLNDFLQFVRPQKFNPDVFDLADAVRGTAAALEREGRLQNVHIEYSIPAELCVWGDEAQIRGALWNILRNAGEAMPDGGQLSISSEAREQQIMLCVCDSGRGFSPEDLQRAFEPFYSTTPEGAGLGLSLARAAVERCGGQMWLENSEERGACVYLTLPDREPTIAP